METWILPGFVSWKRFQRKEGSRSSIDHMISVLIDVPLYTTFVWRYFSEQDTFFGFLRISGCLSWFPPQQKRDPFSQWRRWYFTPYVDDVKVDLPHLGMKLLAPQGVLKHPWRLPKGGRSFWLGRKTEIHLGERVGIFFLGIFWVATVGGRNSAPVDMESSSILLGLIHPRWLARCLNHHKYQ